jgi:predicted RNase H-like nuclease
MSYSSRPYVGVDWDSGSWLAVGYHPDEGFTAMVDSGIENIWDQYESSAKRIVIDVLIRLCNSRDSEDTAGELDDNGELVRPGDRLARSVLTAPRTSSVFNAPARGAVERER